MPYSKFSPDYTTPERDSAESLVADAIRHIFCEVEEVSWTTRCVAGGSLLAVLVSYLKARGIRPTVGVPEATGHGWMHALRMMQMARHAQLFTS